ncbi:unnamed protein product [Malus baccata var. baccata]
MMEMGGTFLISDLEASFGWILVLARGGGSWSAVVLTTTVYLGFFVVVLIVLAHSFDWAVVGFIS